jgi:hypothetical protein
MNSPSKVILRLGSHAEKEYILKLIHLLDGLIIGANLFEATPAATASIFLKASAKKIPLFLDPMTYAYGSYINRETGEEKTDLDWIKSDQIVRKNGRKITVRDYKKSYRKLAEAIGYPFADALDRNRAVSNEDFTADKDIKRFCEATLNYQLSRIDKEFQNDVELKDLAEGISPIPSILFAPYFYILPSQTDSWLDLNLKLVHQSGLIDLGVNVHAVICADHVHLTQPPVLEKLSSEIIKANIKGVWFWFSEFEELTASEEELKNYLRLIQEVSKHKLVYTMHGGFLSLVLGKAGLSGISHGIGYGEQKDVVPVIGQSTPTVRFYLPSVARRLGVPDIERCFDALGVKTPTDFHAKVCDCLVCQGVVVDSLDQFSQYGERRFSTKDSKRRAQTPAAAKRCRYHYLLNRLNERKRLCKLSVPEVIGELEIALRSWGKQPALKDTVSHIPKWIEVLKGIK